MTAVGVEPLRLAARSPDLRAYAERSARSIRPGCLPRSARFRSDVSKKQSVIVLTTAMASVIIIVEALPSLPQQPRQH